MNGERGTGGRRRGIGGAVSGVVLLALLAGVGTGSLRPSAFAEQLAGIVDGAQVDRVVQAVGAGDVAHTTDELVALAGGVVAGAAGIAQQVAGAVDGSGGPGDLVPGAPVPPPPPGPTTCSIPEEPDPATAVDLEQHRGWGGHTIRDHVAQTDEQMRARLALHPIHPHSVSTFSDVAWATEVISAGHACLQAPFTAWRTGQASGHSLRCTITFGLSVGRLLTRDLAAPIAVSEVVIQYGPAAHSPLGYRITTAFPTDGWPPTPCEVL